jgi:ABC-type multidrug transport system fused ATPase/permease subunit
MSPFQVLKSGIGLLTRRERGFLVVAIIFQLLISFADLLALALIGIVGSLGVSYVSGFTLPNSIQTLIERIGLADLPLQRTIMVFAVATAFLFIAKSLATLVLTRRIYLYLANRQTRISVDLAKQLSNAPYTWIKRKDTNEIIYALTDGLGALFLGVIGSLMVVIGEVILLTLILTGLLLIDASTAILTLIFFTFLAIFSYRSVSGYSARLGRQLADSSIAGRNQISTMLFAYKEIFAFQKKEYFLNKFIETRAKTTQSQAKATWLQQIPKANAEIGLVLGGGGLIALQAWQSNAAQGLSVLLVFLAAASRLTPSIMRIQAAFLGFRNSSAAAESTLKIVYALDEMNIEKVEELLEGKRAHFEPVSVSVKDVIFAYPDGSDLALRGLSLEIKAGSFIALAGSSGSGKTTLADILIGIYAPDSGEVRFNGGSNREWLKDNPGGIGYVPQSPYIMSGTFLTNIAMGIPDDEIDLKKIERVIEKSQLAELVKSLPQGLETDLSHFGSRLSGGERQRLALARALYTDPSLLIIDEGTSALDGRTEFEITQSILGLRNSLTIVVIAHRLASIKEADQIFLLNKGELVGVGDFASLKASSVEFREQIEFMSLE